MCILFNTTTQKLKQTTLTGDKRTIRCHCGKVCRSTRGLKQHQSRSRCGPSATQVQRTGPVSGETKENSSQEAPHTAEDLSTLEQPQHQRPVHVNPPPITPIHLSRRERIKWLKTSDNITWMQFDDDLDGILEATSSGPVQKNVHSLTTIAYNLARERFSIMERKGPLQPNRSEIKALNKLFKTSSPTEREGIKDLTSKVNTTPTPPACGLDFYFQCL